jgi:uncharacterized protein YdiU (UPF0061 family)
MVEYDSAFNVTFIEEQKQRIEMRERLNHEHCKDRSLKQTHMWREWLSKYSSLRALSSEKNIKNPKYVLLNYIAKQINLQIEESTAEESVELLDKVLQVFSDPY